MSHRSERELDTAVNRLFEDAKRKKAKIEKIRMESMRSQLSHTKDKPTINHNSRMMVQSSEHVKIQDRVANVQQAKKNKIEVIREQMLREANLRDPDELKPSFKPKINNVSNKISTSRKSGIGSSKRLSNDVDLFNASEQ